MCAYRVSDLVVGAADPKTSVVPIIMKDVEIGWFRYDADVEGYVFICDDTALGRLYKPYSRNDMPDTNALLSVAATAISEHRDFFSGWFSRARYERSGKLSSPRKAAHKKEGVPMVETVFTQRVPKPDPLARDESDIVERLHAMADDALAGRNQDEVQREVEAARALFGFRK